MTWQDYLESKICVCNLSSDVCMPYAACRMPVCVTVPASLKTQQFCETPPILKILNLTMSKTKQFCQTSSASELDDIQNERILRDLLNFRS